MLNKIKYVGHSKNTQHFILIDDPAIELTCSNGEWNVLLPDDDRTSISFLSMYDAVNFAETHAQ